jgi:hypothetical protein
MDGYDRNGPGNRSGEVRYPGEGRRIRKDQWLQGDRGGALMRPEVAEKRLVSLSGLSQQGKRVNGLHRLLVDRVQRLIPSAIPRHGRNACGQGGKAGYHLSDAIH